LALSAFYIKGKIIWAIAIPMAASNALGGWIGKLAINKEVLSIFLFGRSCGDFNPFCIRCLLKISNFANGSVASEFLVKSELIMIVI
jgi:hypothetical protein